MRGCFAHKLFIGGPECMTVILSWSLLRGHCGTIYYTIMSSHPHTHHAGELGGSPVNIGAVVGGVIGGVVAVAAITMVTVVIIVLVLRARPTA